MKLRVIGFVLQILKSESVLEKLKKRNVADKPPKIFIRCSLTKVENQAAHMCPVCCSFPFFALMRCHRGYNWDLNSWFLAFTACF